MGSAACTAVIPFNGHNPHLPLNFFFAAIIHRFQLFLRRIADGNRNIAKYSLIGLLFYIIELFLGQNAVKINSNDITSHMESNVVETVNPMHDT